MNGRFVRNDMQHYTRSSFARSFFQSGTGDAVALDSLSLDDSGGEDEQKPPVNATVPVPQSRPPRPLARRASSRGAAQFRSSSGGAATPGMAASAAAAAAAVGTENADDYSEALGHAGHSSGPASAETDRSWYHDAAGAGFTSSNVNEFVESPAAAAVAHHDNVAAANNQSDSAFGDEEVLEQYRIMAQHEAMLRVKENIGFDAEEYEKRRKLQPPENLSRSNKKSLYGGGKKPQIRLPPLKKITPSNISLKLEEPPMPPPRVNNYFLQQSGLRVPELCAGVAVRGSSSTVALNKDEHVVRCLGCRNQLRVKQLATLVSCPDCNTVSPASSTRR